MLVPAVFPLILICGNSGLSTNPSRYEGNPSAGKTRASAGRCLSGREGRQRAIASLPAGRVGTPEEIASLTAWLLSDEALFVTGGLYTIDGGETA